MAMEWLEHELRLTGTIDDLERADTLRDWLLERGEDISFNQSAAKSHLLHGNEGRRSWLLESRENGQTVKVPSVLYNSEIIALSYAARLHNQRPEDPFIEIRSISDRLETDADPIKSGFVYKLINRLEKWGYLTSKWENFDPNTPGRIVRKRFIAITSYGLNRITNSLSDSTKEE